jgi:hypothetical protein
VLLRLEGRLNAPPHRRATDVLGTGVRCAAVQPVDRARASQRNAHEAEQCTESVSAAHAPPVPPVCGRRTAPPARRYVQRFNSYLDVFHMRFNPDTNDIHARIVRPARRGLCERH